MGPASGGPVDDNRATEQRWMLLGDSNGRGVRSYCREDCPSEDRGAVLLLFQLRNRRISRLIGGGFEVN